LSIALLTIAIKMAETIQAELNADMAEAINLFSESFTWNKSGQSYACVLDDRQHSLLTLKSNFAGARYPKWGELITVAGVVRQIVALNASQLVTSAGGVIESPPFVDRPDDPVLEITFDVITRRA